MKGCTYKLGLSKVTLYGGPYRYKPVDFFGINMAAEIPMPADVRIPTEDFSVPDEQEFLRGIRKGLVALALKKKVYVGCMGGIGRTGLYMAGIAKALGYASPVDHVRGEYVPIAVETREQRQYLEKLDMSSVNLTALAAKVISSLLFWR